MVYWWMPMSIVFVRCHETMTRTKTTMGQLGSSKPIWTLTKRLYLAKHVALWSWDHRQAIELTRLLSIDDMVWMEHTQAIILSHDDHIRVWNFYWTKRINGSFWWVLQKEQFFSCASFIYLIPYLRCSKSVDIQNCKPIEISISLIFSLTPISMGSKQWADAITEKRASHLYFLRAFFSSILFNKEWALTMKSVSVCESAV